ncbi:hypothetical protein SRIMM317S_04234 [Streptomyces rimosus subsp. rimosus]
MGGRTEEQFALLAGHVRQNFDHGLHSGRVSPLGERDPHPAGREMARQGTYSEPFTAAGREQTRERA